MRYGKIVKYFSDKKFGFIRPDTGQDVFFHLSALDEGEATTEIRVGQLVKYELMPRWEAKQQAAEDKRGKSSQPEQPKAKLVTLIDEIPGATMPETDERQGKARHPRARQKKPTWRR